MDPTDHYLTWFGGSVDVDEQITNDFGADLENFRAGKYNLWKNDRDGLLATNILLDQFSRNIHRGKAQAFENDPTVFKLCNELLDNNYKAYSEYAIFERLFLILPLMHSETKKNTERAIIEIEKLVADCKAIELDEYGQTTRMLGINLTASYDHDKTIGLFGRYPHRNEVLGRKSTPEEIEYLKSCERYG